MSAFAKALSPAIREIRIFLSQTGQASAGTRQFVKDSYPILKKSNPDLPILIREVQGTPSRMFARFERGVEKHVELDNISSVEVEKKAAELLSG